MVDKRGKIQNFVIATYNNMEERTFEPLLTARELGILRSIAQGLTTPKIAEELHLSPETVKWHRKRMLAKFSATTSAEMVKRAMEAGIL